MKHRKHLVHSRAFVNKYWFILTGQFGSAPLPNLRHPFSASSPSMCMSRQYRKGSFCPGDCEHTGISKSALFSFLSDAFGQNGNAQYIGLEWNCLIQFRKLHSRWPHASMKLDSLWHTFKGTYMYVMCAYMFYTICISMYIHTYCIYIHTYVYK